MDWENDDSFTLNEEEMAALRETFFIQAMEMTESLSEEVLALDPGKFNGDSIKKIKRYFHTLKGDSSTIGLKGTAGMIHRMEDLMGEVERRKVAIDDDLLDLILRVIDEINSSVKACQSGTEYTVQGHIMERIAGFSVSGRAPKELVLTEYEELKAARSIEDGKKLYSVRVYFSPECELKSAGAMVLAQHLPKGGDIIRTEPDLDSPEVETTEFLHVVTASLKSPEELKHLYTIPEVTGEICVEEVDLDELDVSQHESQGPAEHVQETESVQTVRIMSGKIDQIMDLVGELVMGRLMMGQHITRFEERHPKDELVSSFVNANAFIGRSLADLQRNVMSMRMVSIDRVFKKLPRMVRDLCRGNGKEISLVLEGENTEVDKALVDVVGEPLLHLIRNAVDHGIEPPDERGRAGKSRKGCIRVSAFHKDNDIVIKVEDDGRGINVASLKEKAVKTGVCSAEEAGKMDDREAVGLIFVPSFSTAEVVSDVSGRGMGMDIVKEVVEEMRGVVSVRSDMGSGTVFTLRFPMTLAIIRAIIFMVGGKMYATPMSSVVEILRAFPRDVDLASGKEMLRNRGEVIPLVRLNELIGVPAAPPRKDGKMFVLILSHGDRELGLVVDRLVREEELVVKAVDESWIDTNMVSGASIFGDGTVVMILNAPAVMSRASGETGGVFYRKVAG